MKTPASTDRQAKSPMQLRREPQPSSAEPIRGYAARTTYPVATAARPNQTGLPNQLKAGVENLSGHSLDDVQVHYNSDKPAQLQAHAYAQGTDIHLAPGQEQHLPHEAWHVVQQKQGRVQPTMEMQGMAVNGDKGLEKEADVMGARAAHVDTQLTSVAQGMGQGNGTAQLHALPAKTGADSSVIQRISDEQMEKFRERLINERNNELAAIEQGQGFIMGTHPLPHPKPWATHYQPGGPVLKGTFGLMQSRFDLSGVKEQFQNTIEGAFSGATGSLSHNKLVAGVGMDLFGSMLRNVGRLNKEKAKIERINFGRSLLNGEMTPYEKAFMILPIPTNPNHVKGAENSKLKVVVDRGAPPSFNHNQTSISLMQPTVLHNTAHELQHARDHLHGDLDLSIPEHRLASELNAHTHQDKVSRELTGAGPTYFEGRTPKEMAESYEGKIGKGYIGTLKESEAAVKRWKSSR